MIYDPVFNISLYYSNICDQGVKRVVAPIFRVVNPN